MTLTAHTPAATAYDLGPARALSCRECGHQIPLAAEFACPQCFGPLEVAYDFPAVTRESSTATISAFSSIADARGLRSPRLPIGVATI